MAIDNISNATISLTDYKTDQKVQSVASVQPVKPVEINAVTAKLIRINRTVQTKKKKGMLRQMQAV